MEGESPTLRISVARTSEYLSLIESKVSLLRSWRNNDSILEVFERPPVMFQIILFLRNMLSTNSKMSKMFCCVCILDYCIQSRASSPIKYLWRRFLAKIVNWCKQNDKEWRTFQLAHYPSLKLIVWLIYSFSFCTCLSSSTTKKDQQMVEIFLISNLVLKKQ